MAYLYVPSNHIPLPGKAKCSDPLHYTKLGSRRHFRVLPLAQTHQRERERESCLKMGFLIPRKYTLLFLIISASIISTSAGIYMHIYFFSSCIFHISWDHGIKNKVEFALNLIFQVEDPSSWRMTQLSHWVELMRWTRDVIVNPSVNHSSNDQYQSSNLTIWYLPAWSMHYSIPSQFLSRIYLY